MNSFTKNLLATQQNYIFAKKKSDTTGAEEDADVELPADIYIFFFNLVKSHVHRHMSTHHMRVNTQIRLPSPVASTTFNLQSFYEETPLSLNIS